MMKRSLLMLLAVAFSILGASINASQHRNLILASLQDRHTYEADERSAGAGVSLCIPPFCTGVSSAHLNYSQTAINSHYLSSVGWADKGSPTLQLPLVQARKR